MFYLISHNFQTIVKIKSDLAIVCPFNTFLEQNFLKQFLQNTFSSDMGM